MKSNVILFLNVICIKLYTSYRYFKIAANVSYMLQFRENLIIKYLDTILFKLINKLLKSKNY